MSDGEQMALSRMQTGQSGRVIEIRGGYGMVNRLSALGVRAGKKLTKTSSGFARGPVTVRVDKTQIAIGFGIASRIIVELAK